MKNKIKGKIFPIFIFLLVLPAIVHAQKQTIEVVVEKAEIRAEPNMKAEIIETPSVGSIFEVERKAGDWYEIKFTSKLGITFTGYIHKKYVKVLGEVPEIKKEGKFLIELSGGYFLPSDQRFKSVYGNGTYFGGEISVALMKGIGIWGGAHYLTKKGKSTFSGRDTKLKLSPIYGGMIFKVPEARVSPYASIGIGYFKYKEESALGTVDKGDIGFIGQIGCLFKIIRPIFIDIKGSYSYCKAKPVELEANLGGFQATIGVGFEL